MSDAPSLYCLVYCIRADPHHFAAHTCSMSPWPTRAFPTGACPLRPPTKNLLSKPTGLLSLGYVPSPSAYLLGAFNQLLREFMDNAARHC